MHITRRQHSNLQIKEQWWFVYQSQTRVSSYLGIIRDWKPAPFISIYIRLSTYPVSPYTQWLVKLYEALNHFWIVIESSDWCWETVFDSTAIPHPSLRTMLVTSSNIQIILTECIYMNKGLISCSTNHSCEDWTKECKMTIIFIV